MYSTHLLVGWQDLDTAGRPHWPNYFLWVSRAFDEFLVSRRVDWNQWIEERDVGMPIQHAECSYRAPLQLHDRVTIQLQFREVSARGFETHFTVNHPEGHEVASGLIRRRFVSLKQFCGIQADPTRQLVDSVDNIAEEVG